MSRRAAHRTPPRWTQLEVDRRRWRSMTKSTADLRSIQTRRHAAARRKRRGSRQCRGGLHQRRQVHAVNTSPTPACSSRRLFATLDPRTQECRFRRRDGDGVGPVGSAESCSPIVEAFRSNLEWRRVSYLCTGDAARRIRRVRRSSPQRATEIATGLQELLASTRRPHAEAKRASASMRVGRDLGQDGEGVD